MRYFTFATVLALFASISFAGPTKNYIHCEIASVKDGAIVTATKKNFCSKLKKNQRDKRYGEISVNRNWDVVLSSEFPRVSWKLISYNDLFLTSNMKLKMGNRFDITTQDVSIKCNISGERCAPTEAELFNRQFAK